MREELLRANMVAQKMSTDDLLRKLQDTEGRMSRAAFFNKKNGRSEFTRSEIQAISEVLQLNTEQVMDIFFS